MRFAYQAGRHNPFFHVSGLPERRGSLSTRSFYIDRLELKWREFFHKNGNIILNESFDEEKIYAELLL